MDTTQTVTQADATLAALAAVIGSPVRHSLSPAIHNAAFRSVGLPWVYVAWEVPEGYAPEALGSMERFGIAGLSVTMPHKTAAAESVDELSQDAELLGAVNCVTTDEAGKLTGHNTDGYGLVEALRVEAGFEPTGKSAIVFGAGGAARACVVALAKAGAAKVAVCNRTAEKAEDAASLAQKTAKDAGTKTTAEVVASEAVGEFDLVINATSMGMKDVPGTPFETALLHPDQTVVDLIYEPAETELLKQARSIGANAHNGEAMLVHQAAQAFQLWTGITAPVEAMLSAVKTAKSKAAKQ